MGEQPPWVATPLLDVDEHFEVTKEGQSEASLGLSASKLSFQVSLNAFVGITKNPQNTQRFLHEEALKSFLENQG